MGAEFEFGGARFEIAGEAALFWPAQCALLVADLHLEKASAFAAHGQLLPPYDSLSTLDELAGLARRHGAGRVFCLGDNFHDGGGEARLPEAAAARLTALTAATDWYWITGNHDPDVSGRWGGRVVAEMAVEGIMLRHQADPHWSGPEISGHFHPKYRQVIRGRLVARRCFVSSAGKLLLPAFGALTGGLDADDPAIRAAFGRDVAITALVPAGQHLARLAL